MPVNRALFVFCLFAFGAVGTSTAQARAARDVDYRYEQVWNTVIRLLRVDYRFPIEERDDQHGFVLFTYREYGRSHAASIEAVRAEVEGGGERVHLVVRIEGMPTHTETSVLEDLEQKLRSDYGLPERRPAVAQRSGTPLIPRLSDRTPDDRAASEAARRDPAATDEPARSPAADAAARTAPTSGSTPTGAPTDPPSESAPSARAERTRR